MQCLLLCTLLLLLTKLMQFISLGQENTEITGQDCLVLHTDPALIMIYITLKYDDTQKTKAELLSPFWWCKPRLILVELKYQWIIKRTQRCPSCCHHLILSAPLTAVFPRDSINGLPKPFICFKIYSHTYCFVFPSILNWALIRSPWHSTVPLKVTY